MNPFDRHDIDPLSTADEITERFRELIEDAKEADRQGLRAAWEALTLHPRSRVGLALSTFVDSEPETLELPPPPAASPTSSQLRPEPYPGCSITELTESQKALLVPIADVLASLQRRELCQREPVGHVPLASDPLLEDTWP